MPTLSARFAIETPRLQAMQDAMLARTSSTSTVLITSLREKAKGDRKDIAHAAGPAQEVMHLIGEVAAQGEDCLLSCRVA